MAIRRYEREPRGRVEDRGSGMLAVAEQQRSLARVLGEFRQTTTELVRPTVRASEVKRGQTAGAQAAKKARETGEAPKPLGGGTLYRDSYDRELIESHRASVSAGIVNTLDRLENEAGNDTKLYDSTSSGAREGALKGVDPSLRPEFEQEWDLQQASRRSRVQERERRVNLESAGAERMQAGETFRTAAVKAARAGQVDELMLHRDKFMANLRAGTRSPENPNGLVAPDDAAKMARGFDQELDVEAVIGGFERTLQTQGVDAANSVLDKIEAGQVDTLKDLEPELRDRVVTRLNAMVSAEYADRSRKEAAAKAQVAARERAARDQLADAKAALDAGFQVEGMDDLIKLSEGTEVEGDVRRQVMIARQVRQFALMPPAQREAFLQERESTLRGRQVKAAEVIQLQAFQRVNANLQTQLTQDPLGLAVKQGLVDPLPPLQFGDQAQLNSALQARVEASRVASAHYGREVPPLTAEEADTLGAAFGAADAAGKTELVRTLAAGFGSKFDDAMQQLHKEGYKTFAFIGGLAQENPGTAREVVMGLDLRASDKGLVPKDADTRPELALVRAAYLDSGPVTDSVMALYARKSQVAGDSSGGWDADRFQEAVNDVTGGLVEFESKAGVSVFPAPAAGVDADKFESWIDGLSGARVAAQGGVAGMDPDQVAELIRQRGRLVSVGRGEWLVSLMSARDGTDRYLLKPDGEPFVLRWTP